MDRPPQQFYAARGLDAAAPKYLRNACGTVWLLPVRDGWVSAGQVSDHSDPKLTCQRITERPVQSLLGEIKQYDAIG